MSRRALSVGAALIVAAVAASECGGSPPSSPSTPSNPPIPNNPLPPATLVGAGDIGQCNSPAVVATARLLDNTPGIVFTTGDNAYPNGTAANFRDCYEPHWGRHRARTRPTPGNHEYESAGAAPYFDYFGENAGTPGLGYYSYNAGPWLVIALNSELPAGPGSGQLLWLRTELSINRARCAMAYWHKPLFTSGPNGPNRELREVWRTLYEFDADLVVTGHDHLYERFAPQDADGRPDAVRGLRQITVGTGGGALYTPVMSAPNTEAIGIGHGVLKLTLSEGGYQWEFLPIPGNTFRDTGVGQCH
jgi:acid phosphatase type 7